MSAGARVLRACPCLTYRDVGSALEWLGRAFGIESEVLADQASEAPEHALLHAGETTILVEAERPDELHGPHAGRGWIYVAVTDADAHHERAAAAGAVVHGEPHDFGEGFRGYSASDPEGNLWTFGTARP